MMLLLNTTSVFAVTNAELFTYAQANYPSTFSGTVEAGVYEQYTYNYFQGTNNYLAVDNNAKIFILGPFTNNIISEVGSVADYQNALRRFIGQVGATGPQGLTGATGATGLQGLTGNTGAAGSVGAAGSTGLTGAAGPAGSIGATGNTGAAGSVGAAGSAGSAGSTGPTGAAGPAGSNGTNGTNGSSFAYSTTCGVNGTDACKIGAIGPGGGWIFFVDYNDQYAGFDYLEAAPADITAVAWCDVTDRSIPEAAGWSANAVGAGQTNTTAMLEVCTSGAAYEADAYLTPTKSDWFLGSEGELMLMYTNLRQAGVGGFASNYYWSSTESGSNTAWNQYFGSGYQVNYGKSGALPVVRAVRAF